jgi:predicted nucleic-acid-binding protein
VLAIDTNVIVHYLTDDHPEQGPRARAIIDGAQVFVPVTVMLETEWVLRSAYDYDRTDVVRALRAFGGLPTVSIEDADKVAAALDLATFGMDFADALHLGRSGHCDGFLTFDRRLTKTATDAVHTAVRDA